MTSSLILLQGGLGGLSSLLPFVLIIGIFYVLVFMPQRKRQKQMEEMKSALKTGDKVITNGGIIGVITTVRDTSFYIRSADKTILEISRSSIAAIDEEEKK